MITTTAISESPIHLITDTDPWAIKICGLHPILRSIKSLPPHVPTVTRLIEPSYTVATFASTGRGSAGKKNTMWDAVNLAVQERGLTNEVLRTIALREAGKTMSSSPKALSIRSAGLLNWVGVVSRGATGGELTLWFLQKALGIPIIILKLNERAQYLWKRPMQDNSSDQYRLEMDNETGPYIGLHRDPGSDQWSLVLNVGDANYQRPGLPASSS